MWFWFLPPPPPPPTLQTQASVSKTSLSSFEEIILVVPTVFSQSTLAANVLLAIFAVWLFCCIILIIDGAFTHRLADETRIGVRNFLAFCCNILNAIVFDSAAIVILWTLTNAITLPFTILRIELVRDPSRFIHVTATSKPAFNNFIFFLKTLEWAITIYSTRYVMLRHGIPYKMTLKSIAQYYDYCYGNALPPPDAGVVVGRMIGAHEVVHVHAANNGRRPRRNA